MKKKPTNKTVTIPVKLAAQILDDVEALLTASSKMPYGVRTASLASLVELSQAIGWETPCSQLNELLRRDRKALRKAYAETGMSDFEAACDVIQHLYNEDKKKSRKRKSSK
jgi:hypothetical protein